ncbi:MAG: cytochrome C, partial [Moraxellaceae bacterium]
MKKLIIGLGAIALVGSGIFLYSAYGGFGDELKAPSGEPFVNVVPDDWVTFKQAKMAARDTHIAQHQVAYNRFADFAESETDGLPYIILKLLPVLAPEYWGEGDNFLSVMGLFFDERLPGAPVPRGMGFSGLSRIDLQGNIDYASFSCGACHIGRVRLDNNKMYYLDGGINSEFNVVGYRKRVVQTINKVAGAETDPQKRVALVMQKILSALDQVHTSNPTYFYKNFSYENRVFDASYEQSQINLFKTMAGPVVSEFMRHHENEYHGWKKFVDKYYQGAQQQLLDGLPGMEDAIGFNTVKANANLNSKPLTKPFATLALPPSHGVTDIMAVWEQHTHDPLWNDEKTDLVNGGGQWTGHIPLPIYKNIAAQLTIGYENVDVRISA